MLPSKAGALLTTQLLTIGGDTRQRLLEADPAHSLEEGSDVVDQKIRLLHRWKMPAAIEIRPVHDIVGALGESPDGRKGPFRLRGFKGCLFWLASHILILDTIRARFTALINWAALFLFRELPLRLDVSADRRQAAA